jgi:transcriptional regulator with XRE-family HTH domain
MKTFSEKLRELRRLAGWSQRQAALEVGVKTITWQSWELQPDRLPRVQTYMRVQELFTEYGVQ